MYSEHNVGSINKSTVEPRDVDTFGTRIHGGVLISVMINIIGFYYLESPSHQGVPLS